MVAPNIEVIFQSLTDKQHEAVRLAAGHLTSKQIAQDLGVAPATVDKRIDAVRAKIGFPPRTELLRLYLAWLETGEQTCRGTIPLTQHSEIPERVGQQPEPRFHVFEDSLVFDERASWDQPTSALSSGIKLSDLGVIGKTLIMLAGAIFVLMVAVLSIAFSTALETLLKIG